MTKNTENSGSLDIEAQTPLQASDSVGVAMMDVLRSSLSLSFGSANPHSTLAEEFNLSSRIHSSRWWS